MNRLKDEGMENIFLRRGIQEDVMFLFKLANDKECKNNSLNPHEITLEEHMKWFKEMLLSNTQRQYILMDGSQSVGQGRLEIIGDSCRISYSIIPERRGQGYGKCLIQLLNQTIPKDFSNCICCFGEVLKKNIASQKIFDELGYTSEEREDYFYYYKYIVQ